MYFLNDIHMSTHSLKGNRSVLHLGRGQLAYQYLIYNINGNQSTTSQVTTLTFWQIMCFSTTYADSSQTACRHRRRRLPRCPPPPPPRLLHAAKWPCATCGNGVWCPARCLVPPRPPPRHPGGTVKKQIDGKEVQLGIPSIQIPTMALTFSSMMSISEYFIPFTKIGISLY